jgi:putative nucleotidyltransferase with HDIG domain
MDTLESRMDAKSQPAQEPKPRELRALVVDDEASICALLSEKLARAGFKCRCATSGEEALTLLQGNTYDLVISDLRMPGMSGLELLDEVSRKYPHSAFLMATGEADVRTGVEAMKKGASDYLVKPFQLEEVISRVQQALEKKRLELEVASYRRHLEEMVEQRTRQLQAALKRVELTYDETLEALGAALDLRDDETAGHSRRVSRYCLAMAKTMGCSSEQLKHLARGAYLHDIGKIGIPDAILLKGGKLTPEQMAIMQSHARVGYELVSRIAFLAPAAEIVLTHHERFDGTGYPQGLREEEIPLGARIFVVADTLDAMTSDRPYRQALPFSAAQAEIIRESGRQFDPEVVRVFLSIPQQTWDDIRLEVAGIRLGPLMTGSVSALPAPWRSYSQ